MRRLLPLFAALYLSAAPLLAADAPPLVEPEPLAHRLLAEAEAFTATFDREQEEAEWREQLDGWEARLAESEHYIASGQHNNIQSGLIYDALSHVLSEIEPRRSSEASRPDEMQALLDALGEPPAEGEPAESAEIAKHRTGYRRELSRLRERLSQIELASTRAQRLQEQISTLRRDALLDQLTERFPDPWRPATLRHALRDAAGQLRALLAAPTDWYAGLDDTARQRLLIWPFTAILFSALLAGWLLRRLLLSRYGRDPALRNPGSSRRVLAALAEGAAHGLIPALLFGGLLLWFNRPDSSIDGLFADVVNSALLGAVFLVTTTALTRAMLAPERPEWRLTGQSAEGANAVGYAMLGLLTVMALEVFYGRATANLLPSAELRASSVAVFVGLKSVFLLLLLRRRWWHRNARSSARSARRGGWRELFQRLLLVLVWAALIAALAGYSTLADYLLSRLLLSVTVLLLLVAGRAMIRELAAALARSRLLRRTLRLRVITLRRFKFWFRVLLDPLLFVLAALWIVQIWGVPQQDLLRWTEEALTGFEVGAITISVTDIAFALLVFAVAMGLTRLIQRGLLNHALPQITENEGLQHSLSAATGYLGLVVAVMLFVAALGINLESIALVAGALSVGIGFGLQNVVSNFVSGLILIVERPIKVGDWIEIGGQQGFVQRINFRATELETAQRASVIIPNAELISAPVTNLTYKDRLARVEVLVGVAYDSDAEQIRTLLMAAAEQHPLVFKDPEPVVLLQDFAEHALQFELRCFINEATLRTRVGSDLRFAILAAFARTGVSIPLPQRVLHFAGPIPGRGSDRD